MAEGIFQQPQVRFQIIYSNGFQQDEAQKIRKDLLDHGAEESEHGITHQNEKVLLDTVTHIITDTIEFPNYDAAIEPSLNKAVVKPEWVSACLLKGKQANARQYSPDPKMFFSGMIVCCVDLPEGDKDAIIGYVLAVGGLHSSTVTKMVTHIIALTTEAEKCQLALAKNLKCKIVLPHWIDDCLSIRARIDETPYCLPDPEILRVGAGEKVPDSNRNDLRGASTACPSKLPTPASSPDSSRAPLTVFQGKTVMLHNDLQIGSRLRGVIESIIESGEGSNTGSVYKADFFICQYRESLDYRIASRAGKDVGNLSWLYHLITHNTWTSPMRRLLHYPTSKQGLPGFKNFRISVSNYNGEARIYLENLAKAAGSEFTRTMKDDNTHLITAHPHSEKCDAAKEWNIHIVNHLWLEESYAKWQIQTLSNSEYTEFPPRTNLGEIVGRTGIDRKAVEKCFFPPGSDIDRASEGEPPEKHNHVATAKANLRTSASGLGREAPLQQLPQDGSTPRASKANRRHTDGETIQTPANARFAIAGKENETPSTTGSRSAKAKAAAKLHDLAPDIALFERESKRVGGVIHGGRKHSQDLVHKGNRKRSMSADEDNDTDTDEVAKAVKKPKKSSGLPPPAMRLLLSGYKRWTSSQPKRESEERILLRELGILLVNTPQTCSHLASPKIVRTQKFICALAHAPTVLNTDFVDDCLSQNRLLNPDEYIMRDTDYEKKCSFKLSDALARAKTNKGHLLHGYSVYCTENVYGGFDTYKAIVETNGGKCMLYRARAGQTLRAGSAESPSDAESDEPLDVYLVSGTTPEEGRIWPRFRQMVEANGKTPRIVKYDWVLNAALFQQTNLKGQYELSESDIEDAAA